MSTVTELAPVEAAYDVQFDVADTEAAATEATQPLYVYELRTGLDGAAAAVQESLSRRW